MFDMKKQLMWAKLKVGLVVSLALLVLFVTVFFAGGIQSILSPKVDIKAQIKDVRGLRKGAPVWVSGIEIGSVKSIDLHPKHGTLVTMAIEKEALSYIKRDSEASILTMGLLGDKYVELSTGSPEAKQLQPGDMINGSTQLEIQDIVNASLVSLSKVTEFVEKLGTFLEKFEKSEGTIARFFKDPSIYDSLKETTASLSNILNDFEKSNGSLKKLIDDPSLYENMVSTTSSLQEFSENLNSSSGTLKRFLEDPEVYENFRNASVKLNAILTKIESGKGLAGSLISDDALAMEVRDTLVELKKTMKEFNELMTEIKLHPHRYIKFSIF